MVRDDGTGNLKPTLESYAREKVTRVNEFYDNYALVSTLLGIILGKPPKLPPPAS